MWKIFALLVHILMLGYISMIYFQSTVLNGMLPQVTHRDLGLEPPADRLVVFITDGFRAESFFRNNCSGLPSLRNILLNEGLAGVARTCAPTQSRPGHIAIFGGFNEDPAAAMTNFQKNPDVFDTVFNRTAGTWGWGGRPVITIFNDLVTKKGPVNFEMYTLNEEMGIYGADNWVFNKVRHFMASNANVLMVRDKLPSMFLIYLGDLDLAGHSAKPNTAEYLKILNNTQAGIAEMYELFERTFKDKRTVYLLTSDHGMTDSGAHGAGSQLEIEVPFLLWGAGVKRAAPNAGHFFKIGEHGVRRPLHELDQVQMAPLMSALIGLPPPVNNMATLPLGYINVGAKHEAHALHLNALQLLAQVNRMQQLHQRDRIIDWLPTFESLEEHRVETYKQQFEHLMKLNYAREAIQTSQEMIRLSLKCLESYRNYYRIPLSVACIVMYLGWLYYLVAKQARASSAPKHDWLDLPIIILFVLEIVLALLLYLHKVSCWTSFYLLVPLPVWIMALRERGLHTKCIEAPLMQLAWIVCTAALLIATIHYRELTTLGYFIVVCINNWRAFTRPTLKFALWILLVLLLAGFSLVRPNLGYHSKCLLFTSMVFTVLRPLVLGESHAWRVWISNSAALLLGGYVVHRILCDKLISQWLHGTAWIYLVFALISIPYSNARSPRTRVQLILFNLSTIYTLLCLSYESIFIQVLCTEFLIGVEVRDESKQLEDDEDDSDGDEADKPAKALTSVQHILNCYRYALLIIFYTYFSLIGTGNLPHINSFDPDTARVFVRELSPALIGSLIVLKLFIPNIIIMSSMYALCTKARQNVRGIFICLFLICDAMCLYFFFFVRNSGSWSGVRASLSNLLIVHGLPILLIVFSWVPKQFLSALPMTMLPMLSWKTDVHISQPGQSQA
ncbi:GPI ethanolamine phosphate transferase 1-like [Drosophila sulfurigaster albostrigata]|uniref:GPI ethanolamine phosphate transferase 1-like n=1 Tax=Drosophila sulfurigaster albostrigata TaxID=89887 RepID=UPI002D219F0C|nr:GPI ethanolamine phosphate transferase 1-like [Drosophila sulfurigaster albostrigata]